MTSDLGREQPDNCYGFRQLRLYHHAMGRAEPPVLDELLKQRLYRLLSTINGGKSAKADGEYAVGTSIGSVRSENQDAALILRARFGRQPHRDFDVGIVCDGLGGMQRGREAAIVGLVQFLGSLLDSTDAPLEHRCRAALASANDVIYRRLHGSGGTTLSAAVLQRNREPVFAHAGDTRVYLLRAKSDLEQVSQDDTLRAALNKPVDESDDYGSRLIQFVGMGESFEPHLFRGSSTSDLVLLTSDGVHGVAPSTLNRAVRASSGPSDLVRRLLQLSDVLGGLDNATALALPSRLSHPSEGTAGSYLSFLTSTEVFEVWLSDQVGSKDQGRPDRGVGASRETSKPPEPERKTQTKSKGSRSKKQKAAKKAPPPEQLELSPQPPEVSVEFPDPKAQGESS